MEKNINPIISQIKQLGPEAIDLFIQNAKQLDKESVQAHIQEMKPEINFAAFVAYDKNNNPLGGVCAHISFGPFPYIPIILKFGSIWGFWGENSVLSKLIRKAVCYLRPFGVIKILTFAYSSEHFELLQSLNFCHSNALRIDLTKKDNIIVPEPEIPGITVKVLEPSYDESRYEHWMRMWKDNGITNFKPNAKEITDTFVKEAREKHHYRTIGAFKDGNLIGSASINDFFGVEPCQKVGGGWAVYVLPEYRRHGIGTCIATWILKYFKDNGYTSIRLVYASEEGRRIYQRLGFEKSNFLIMEHKSIKDCFDPFISDVEVTNDIYSLAIPGQLKAVGCHDRKSKFTGQSFKERAKHMGKNFKLDKLKQEHQVGEKFDQLAQHWEESATGMEYEAVFEFIAKTYKSYEINDKMTILDLCCGIGMPGQTLRMLGYKGKLIGCDISKEMLKKATERGCYDDLFIQDVNEGLKCFEDSLDVIIITGSMELLDSQVVLENCHKCLKGKGEIWISFLWNKDGKNATEHQKAIAFTENEVIELVNKKGFFIIGKIEKCDKAYLVPTPTEGDSILVPVPYLFLRIKKN